MLNFISYGLLHASIGKMIIYTLMMTHITIMGVTLYLHRCQAHRSLELHGIVSHFFRFWLWLTTGQVTKQWAAIHRKHHAFSDKLGDPHSPVIFGLKKLLLEGTELYRTEAKNTETIEKYGVGTPNDWIEKNLYSKYNMLGVSLMLVIDLLLFGVMGLSIWAIQMMWIPFWAAGVINGIGHYYGYRNFPVSDSSRNIVPIGIFIGGEELHNNHHAYGTSAKFSYKWYEFDYGWLWIKVLSFFKLAKARRIYPTLKIAKMPKVVDYHTLETIISNRYNIVVRYTKLIKRDCKLELNKLSKSLKEKISWSKVKTALYKDEEELTIAEKKLLKTLSHNNAVFGKIIGLREELSKIWKRSNLSKEELLTILQNFCKKAEESGIEKLRIFSLNLRASY